ncbi:MAG TPA: Flp pilus assembly protein CpaB [Rhizomicrobium sp.]|nr:Flp pilus assembly protein CpaB [Rhizomicrobium sp.]
MNTKRLAVLGFAGIMAVAAALLARGLMGGGTPKAVAKVAPPVAMSDVLVASSNLQPGHALLADQVHWQRWPSASVDSSFITRKSVVSIDDAVKGTVVRTPLLAGQPIATTAIVHGHSAGFMSAMLMPDMRAVSINISADSGAGGFILPNDHVDVILARKLEGNPLRVEAKTILSDVRVLAVDQIFKQDKDTKSVIGKTATLELTPGQAQNVAAAEDLGTISLSLRPLADSDTPVASNLPGDDDREGQVAIIRYGVTHDTGVGGKSQ